MNMGNQTIKTGFVLLEITTDSRKKILLFGLILVLYVVTVVGNIGMIIVIRLSPPLHTPMYYFISNLSFIDFLLASIIVPNMLWNFLAKKAIISFLACAAQVYGFVALAAADLCILSLMAYDRYTAICHPLHYEVLMDKGRCHRLAAGSYIVTVLYSMTLTVTTMRLPFCGEREIQHFICEIPLLLKLSCIDATFVYVLVFAAGGIFTAIFMTCILISYSYILLAVLRYPSTEKRWKAFSTCSSHILTVTLFYSTASMMYFRPISSTATTYNGVLSVFYTLVVPMLNPFIYSVRNNDVKAALRKLVITLCCFKHRH